VDNGQIRLAVKALYPNGNWATQVDRMDDDRVIAIFLKNIENPPDLPEKEKPPEQGRLF
jgi:hypothetical protein